MNDDIKKIVITALISGFIGILISDIIKPTLKIILVKIKDILKVCFNNIIQMKSKIVVKVYERKNPYIKRIKNYKTSLSFSDYKVLCKKKEQGTLSPIELEAYEYEKDIISRQVKMMKDSVQAQQDEMREILSLRQITRKK